MDYLKLIAFDEDDLKVFSAHLQDAVVRVSEIGYLAGEKRFAMVMNRFNWQKVIAAKGAGESGEFERRLAALRFERVLGAQYKGLTPGKGDQVLNLLALEFQAGEAPGGILLLRFSGEAAIRLQIECIEAELADLGAAWSTNNQPVHPED